MNATIEPGFDEEVVRSAADRATILFGGVPPLLGEKKAGRYWKHFSSRYRRLVSAKPETPDASLHAAAPDDREDLASLVRRNRRLLRSEYEEIGKSAPYWGNLPAGIDRQSEPAPRIVLLAMSFLEVNGDVWAKSSWTTFLQRLQEKQPLLAREIWSLVPVLKLALLQRFLVHASALEEQNQGGAPTAFAALAACLKSMERLGHVNWPQFLAGLVAFDGLLRQDPAGTYSGMDRRSQDLYQREVSKIARYANRSEVGVAEAAIALAGKSIPHETVDRFKRIHVGYYLAGDGRPELERVVGYHPPLFERFKASLRLHRDLFYTGGIIAITAVLLSLILFPHISARMSMPGVVIGMLLVLLPASQTATDLMNNFVRLMFPAKPLPKLDLTSGIPVEFTSLIAVPTLLLSRPQVEELVQNVEVRYLANRDANLHFALLTDLPDSTVEPEEDDRSPLVEYAVELIGELNRRYAVEGRGTFLLLHRRRIFDYRQGAWMGWERKRGKLLDLNNLICGEADAFPVKSMVLSSLRHIRYVITLDGDTQLPRGAAHGMIGALAHPLNRAIVDPDRTVRQGYGILQPRVDVSVHSANHSRLAALQSGETGMDPYSRAVSDVYQDLYGEAIFTGKGIYDVAVLQQVLDKRFPLDSLLSHDLIEGAYARVGLVSDIEVIDDYPSHYSAWARRRHRWVRGDWQILEWLFDRVPDEEGRMVANSISFISQWKILDNLRRSLIETSAFVLLLVGWFAIPAERTFWTLCVLGLLFLSAYVQFFWALVRAVWARDVKAAGTAFGALLSGNLLAGIVLAFLPSQVMTTVDAIARATFRRFVSGHRLLEWETAAQAEDNRKAAATDRYLRFVPLLASLLGLLLVMESRKGIWTAIPILALWTLTDPLTSWLNSRPFHREYRPRRARAAFLRNVALRTWRYFAEFSTEENHWLIPDNVQEAGKRKAERISPTNVGLLLNARQAALEFGYLTLPEFASLTRRSLETLQRMPKYRGHLFNFHDTRTLEVMAPPMVTTVDSGNLCASLISLAMGCRRRSRSPLLSRSLLKGIDDHRELLRSLGSPVPDGLPGTVEADGPEWVEQLVRLAELVAKRHDGLLAESDAATDEQAWWMRETNQRLLALGRLIEIYTPWLAQEFETLRRTVLAGFGSRLTIVPLEDATGLMLEIETELQQFAATAGIPLEAVQSAQRLLARIADARTATAAVTLELASLARAADDFVLDMDFTYLQDPERELLSIGYTPSEDLLENSCFDLLASEARMAVFVAIAKGDIPQQTWFRLGRTHVRHNGRLVLLSWTGTMFEYLMPSLWMESYPNTVLWRSQTGAVAIQRAFARKLNIPWGVSESGYSETDDAGNYQYYAFGVPWIALKFGATAGPVISPYSACLALEVDPRRAVRNLTRMQKLGWLTGYGFYEAADYIGAEGEQHLETPVEVRSWMIHHQGMSLLALCNLLHGRPFQKDFHASPIIRSTERLLHERPQIM